MKRCSLCGKSMKGTNSSFGLNCLKSSCKILNVKEVKNLKGEKVVNKKVAKMLNKNDLSQEQQKLLTNRYLTLKLLEKVDINCYDDIKQEIAKDIEKIDKVTQEKELTSMKTMPLNYAYQILKLYNKYNLNEKNWNLEEEFNYKQNVTFNAILFGFSYYYNKKPYLSGMLQYIQKWFWEKGINFLYSKNWECAAKLLNYSIQADPKDMQIEENDIIIEKIKKDKNFQNKIESIVKKYGKSNNFDTTNFNEAQDIEYKSLCFENRDLIYALNNTTINVTGNKTNNKWSLEVYIKDIYDFTDYKEVQEIILAGNVKQMLGLTANNLAMISTSCGLINPYNITIKFCIEY